MEIFYSGLLILNVSKSAMVSPGNKSMLSSSNNIIAPFGILGKKCFKALAVVRINQHLDVAKIRAYRIFFYVFRNC